MTAGLGDIASFSMSSVGYPYPNYTWSHNGEVLSDSMVQNYAWYSGVEIRNVSLADFGNYTLTMNNSLGIYEAVYELIPDGKGLVKLNGEYYTITHSSEAAHVVKS